MQDLTLLGAIVATVLCTAMAAFQATLAAGTAVGPRDRVGVSGDLVSAASLGRVPALPFAHPA